MMPTPVPMRAPDTGWPVATPTPVPMSPPATVAHPETAVTARKTAARKLIVRNIINSKTMRDPSKPWRRGSGKSTIRRLARDAARLTTALALVLSELGTARAAARESDAYVAQLADLINGYRTQHRLQRLASDTALSNLAHEHARSMARQNRLSHAGFQQRFEAARSPACVENVAVGSGAPEAEFDAWRNSPIHARNLLDARITRMGIAIDGRYVAFFACQ